jgi:uncharacterized protein (TIGR02145 family)
MKKFILFSISILLIYGCTSLNENSTNSGVPNAPSNLIGDGYLSYTEIGMSWTDNSSNEEGFKIERKTGTGAYTTIATTIFSGLNDPTYTSFTDTGLSLNTTYTYRVCSYNSDGNSTYSNELTLTTWADGAYITTSGVSAITTTTAMCGGIVTNDGGAFVTERGICWSNSYEPTISISTKTIDGTGTGDFTSSITGLTPNTTYFVRAYATNSVGTTYGVERSFTTAFPPIYPITDIDGNTYQTVRICNQVWTTSNLKVSRYRNGDIIPQVTSNVQWASLTTGAWCYYNNDPTTESTYGRLYNWYAVTDPRGLAPVGFHIPSSSEFNELKTCAGNNGGGKLKEAGTAHWTSPNLALNTGCMTCTTPANNSLGFSALPTQERWENGGFSTWNFGKYAFFWGSSDGVNLTLKNEDPHIYISTSYPKKYGFSVRCVRD